MTLADEHGRPVVTTDALLGMVRAGSLADQGRPTWDLAADAIDAGRTDDAVLLARYAVTEAREAYELYREWVEELPTAIIQLGADASRVEASQAEISAATGIADGLDVDRAWHRFEDAVEQAVGSCGAGEPERAKRELVSARRLWLKGHDRIHDHICAGLDLAARELGEAEIGRLWDELLKDLYAGRGRMLEAGGDPSASVRTLVLDVAAALRGHLSGPDRSGSVEISEEEDFWRISIPFCGSGGRTYASAYDGSDGPKAGMTAEAHPWSWGSEGVCLYCVHCCQLQQLVPAKTLGRPLRVVDPPRWPRDRDAPRCNWYVYKDDQRIPGSAWTDVGATPPK